jgi:hypothetical protein
VFAYGSDSRLIFIGRLFEARDRGVDMLAQVQGQPIHIHDRVETGDMVLDQVRQSLFNTPDQFENLFKGFLPPDTRFILAGQAGARAVLVSGHETWAAMVGNTQVYECNGSPKHYFPDPQVSEGETCPKWPECTAPGGGKTVVTAM